MTNQQSIDLLDQYGIDISSKLMSYTSSDYLKNEAKYGTYDFAMFFHELGLDVNFDTRKEGELLVRYFLAAVASYIVDNTDVNFDECIKQARNKTDQMMIMLGIPKTVIFVPKEEQKRSKKVQAIKIYRDNPEADNQTLIKLFIEQLGMKRQSAIVYASMVQHKW